MAIDADELALPGEQVTVELGEGGGAPTTIGQSSARRTLGLAGQYAVLVALAAIVVTPLFYTIIQGLSPPFPYIGEGQPPHPVAVSWKDRTWSSGGAVSVVGRTLLVLPSPGGSCGLRPGPSAAPARSPTPAVSVRWSPARWRSRC
jgi:hypothetical protein